MPEATPDNISVTAAPDGSRVERLPDSPQAWEKRRKWIQNHQDAKRKRDSDGDPVPGDQADEKRSKHFHNKDAVMIEDL